MAREERPASDIQVGDRVWFPGSRRPVAVEQTVLQNETVILFSTTSRWMLKQDYKIAVDAPEETEDGDT